MGYAQAMQAYAALDPALTSPTRAEARVFTQVTKRLVAAFAEDAVPQPARIAALHDNRTLWQTAALQVADDANGLPDETRAAILGLTAFVERQTSALMRGEGSVDVLVEINSRFVAGLSTGGSVACPA